MILRKVCQDMFIRKTGFFLINLLLVLCFLVVPPIASATGLMLDEDLCDTVKIDFSTFDPGNTHHYVYTYRYPRINDSESCASDINTVYDYAIDDALNFGISMDLESIQYAGQFDTDHYKSVSYELTCNNDSFISFLITEQSTSDYGNSTRLYGHTFDINNVKGGTTLALPYLLGTLRYDQPYDEWLEIRQTEKADAAVRSLIWTIIEERAEEGTIVLYEDVSEETLEDILYPEEDFYLDADGNPVFFIYPGRIADESSGFLFFALEIDDILDEL